jgi:hypothetical protein
MKSGFSAKIAETKLPRCVVGKEVFQWRGEASCNFLGGYLKYIKRHLCKSKHSNDQWRRVTRCVYEPRVSGKGLFSGSLRSVNLQNRVKVSAERHRHQAGYLLNGNKGQILNMRHKRTWVKYNFNSPANIDGLGMRGSGSKSSPDYIHIKIYYGSKHYTVIRKLHLGSAEKMIWKGHIKGVTVIKYFLVNTRSKLLTLSQLTFYQEKGPRLPRSSVRKSFTAKNEFDSNAPSSSLKVSGGGKRSMSVDNGNNKVYNFNTGWTQWYGSRVTSLPNRNFVIQFQFKTRQAKSGMFEMHYKGHDREIGLYGGRPYVRVWKGAGW